MDTNLPPSNQETSPGAEGLPAQTGGSAPVGTAPATDQKNGSTVFRRLSSFSADALRKFRARQEDFVRSFAARLSGHLRLEIGVTLSRLDMVGFGKLIGELSNPTHLTLVKLEPLKGICLLEIPSQLGLSLVDREMGGPGECLEQDRALTEIESRVLSRIIEITLNEWCAAWSDLLDLRPVIMGHESNGAFIKNIALDTTMLVLGVEMKIGDSTKQIRLGFPHGTLEPLIQKLDGGAEPEKKPAMPTTSAGLKWNPVLNDVHVPVTAEFRGLKLATRDLTNLKAGDVLQLDPEIFQHIRIALAKKPKFIATMGRCGPHWAAKITTIL
jgi:flagellar motor switch protein FliM